MTHPNPWRAPSKIVLAFTLAFTSVAAPTPALAGPWTKGPGELYVKLGEGAFLSDSFVGPDGKVVKGTKYAGITTSAYFEVGLIKGLQVQGLLPYTIGINTFDDGVTAIRSGGGDMLVGLQASPPLGLPLAARLELKIPLYDVGDSPEFFGSRYPAFGDGQIDVTLWLGAGGSLPGPFYTWGEVGYRFRTEAFIGDGPVDKREFSDSVAWLGQVGWTFYKRMILAVNFIGVMALAGEEDIYTKSYITLGPTVFLPVWRGLAIEAGFDPIVYARNSAPGFSISLGVSYSR
ncbi:MAG: hypothetical protein JRH20_17100 [Deltaproteobacteria bacterium]|nr:hypothetical protein [Deltaproteobacteria bacterium]